MMKIESVNPENLDQAVGVYEASWRESHRQICSTEFLAKRDYRGYLLQRMNGLYLVSDGEPVGVFRLTDGKIADLYIHPHFRARGYGSACLKYAIAKNKQLSLTVLSSNEGAIRLYKRMNFCFTGADTQLRDDLWEREMTYTENHNG